MYEGMDSVTDAEHPSNISSYRRGTNPSQKKTFENYQQLDLFTLPRKMDEMITPRIGIQNTFSNRTGNREKLIDYNNFNYTHRIDEHLPKKKVQRKKQIESIKRLVQPRWK